jgi:hypothetical protein
LHHALAKCAATATLYIRTPDFPGFLVGSTPEHFTFQAQPDRIDSIGAISMPVHWAKVMQPDRKIPGTQAEKPLPAWAGSRLRPESGRISLFGSAEASRRQRILSADFLNIFPEKL